MKLARFRHRGTVSVGLVEDSHLQPVSQTLAQLVAGAAVTPVGATVPLAEVELLAPLTEACRGVLCVGINYVEHQKESAEAFVATVPDDPIVFFKTPSAIAGPYADLPLEPSVSEQFDWEVELGVVIGTGGRNIARSDAGAHVYGYTVVNDITARDVQHRHKQWHLGKNVDGCTPVGPWIVTRDEVGYPPVLDLSLTVNGVLMQTANTRDMIFDIADQIAIISTYVALQPGDVIATGTPAGVGFARKPAIFLRAGDVVETTVVGVGTLKNRVTVCDLATADASAELDAELQPVLVQEAGV
jgi:2-keto-4-pentenoate hydratase/2-oxohepta-3-ene-1,7-dioic acid hydratase in catechol pathway